MQLICMLVKNEIYTTPIAPLSRFDNFSISGGTGQAFPGMETGTPGPVFHPALTRRDDY